MISFFLPSSGNKITSIALCAVVVAINLLFVITTVMDADLSAGLLTVVGELRERIGRNF